MNEKELIEGCIQNDRRCQNELYKRYFPLMSSIALRYGRDEQEALELINEGYLKVMMNISSYNPKYSLATWMRNVLVNHIISEFRKNKSLREMITHQEDVMEDSELTLNSGELKLFEEDLLALIKSLPQVTGKVFNLFAIDGFKHQEIAALLGIQEGTSKWHVNEARRRLKQGIELLNSKGPINLETGT